MTRVRLAAVPLLAGLLPLTAGALGLGEMTLRSGLNQPFVAEIPVTADSADEFNQLSVQLAPAAAFERFGLDRPSFLDDLSFQIQRDGSRTVVRVTSTQPVSEPFVSLLLDVGWPQGRLLREYTVLLDPPAFAGGNSPGRDGARAPASPPMAAGPAPAPPAIRRPQAPDSPSVAGAAGVPNAAAAGRLSSGPDGDSYGPVRSNETLWAISERLRGSSNVSVNQMMVALYRANPEAFAGNINRLRRGAILRVPAGSDLTGISSRDAAAEVQRQEEEWRNAASGTPAPARLQLVPPAEQPAGGGAGTAAGTSPAAAANRQGLERELAEQQRLLSLKDSQLKALQDRVSQLEGKAAPAAESPPPAVDSTAEAPAAPAAAVAPAPVTSAEAPAIKPQAAETRKAAKRTSRERDTGGGFLSSLAGLIFNVWFLVSAAVVLLAGLFFVFARRRMATADATGDRFANELRGEMPPGAGGGAQSAVRRDGYSVEEGAGDRTQSTPSLGRGAARDPDAEAPLERTISTEGAVELDQADVVAEADFHMAYGLYDQAAELLTRALRDNPDRRDLRLKLLEVYFIWENKAAFLKEAQTYQRQSKGAADPGWNKVVIMGKQICPGEPLFAGAVATTGDVGLDLSLADEHGTGAVDIAFDEGSEDSLDVDFTAARKGSAPDGLDFDLGSEDEESIERTSVMRTDATQGGSAGGARTAEMPTVEARYVGDFAPTVESPGVGASTMETPTIESPGVGASTMETPTIRSRELGASTMETPTLESAVPGSRAGALDSRRVGGSDQTEEINLEDLGLDLAGLDQVAGELGTGVHESLDGDADGDDVYDLGTADDDESDLLDALEGDSTAEVRGMALDEGTLDLPAFGNAMEKSAASRDRARDTASDTAEHRVPEDTAEQPRASAAALGDVSAEISQVDFDIGDGSAEDLEPTSVLTGRRRGPEGPTMTEVGTKLDLARAYVDMGDPDGARSILNEVLEEGDSAQRQEARRLLDDLTD